METMSTNALSFRTSTYARNIYCYGTQRLAARDGFTGVADGYYTPVEQYAAQNYALSVIDNALDQGWISQTEYDETLSYMTVA